MNFRSRCFLQAAIDNAMGVVPAFAAENIGARAGGGLVNVRVKSLVAFARKICLKSPIKKYAAHS
jgi:hypothetical protein